MRTGEMILYHGSYIEVRQPDLALCREGKDFGKGFYLTTDREQAKRFVRQSVIRAAQRGDVPRSRAFGFVSCFSFSEESSLRAYHFEEADIPWLHCIVSHRKRNSIPGERKKWKGFDLISGKIANDFTNAVITTYLDGGYGKIGSENAGRTAISLLEPDRLNDQLCFRTTKALKTLVFMKSERISL